MLKQAKVSLTKCFDRAGLVVRRKHDIIVSGVRHRDIFPYATYSPWLEDCEFAAVYSQIKVNTLVDEYRCYELWQLTAQAAHLPGDAIEVGVWRGGTGSLIAARTKQLAPSKTVYLCDTFTGVVKAGASDSIYRGGEHSDSSVDVVRSLIRELNLSNVAVLQGTFPDQTAASLTTSRFAFVHIDVDVYESAKDVFTFLWPRMPIGGIVVFDDYGFRFCDGITKLVESYRHETDRVVIYNLNGHAIVIKIADRSESKR